MAIIKAPTSRDIVYNGTHGDLSCAMAYVEMESVSNGDVVKVLDLPLGLELTELKFMHDLLATADSLEFFLYTSSYKKIPLGKKTQLGGSPQVEIKNIDMTLEEPAALCFVFNPTTTLDKVVVGEVGGSTNIVKATSFYISSLHRMFIGDTQQATIDKRRLRPTNATLNIEWASDKTAVATIDKSSGLITAVGLGSAHIIAKDTYTGKSIKAIVDVKFDYSTLPMAHPDRQYVLVPAHSSRGVIRPDFKPAKAPDPAKFAPVYKLKIETKYKKVSVQTNTGRSYAKGIDAEFIIYDISKKKALKTINYHLQEQNIQGAYSYEGAIVDADLPLYQQADSNENIVIMVTLTITP